MKRKLRVLVLDDSAICRAQLRAFLEHDGDIEVVDEGASGEDAPQRIQKSRPDILLVDLQMPRMGGRETISAVMASVPVPILVVTATPLGDSKGLVFESIRRGALDVARKPDARDVAEQARLRDLVRRLSSVPVVRHVAGKLAAMAPPPAPAPIRQEPPPPEPRPEIRNERVPVIGIASSAGGPSALATMLASYSPALPAAVIVVQHLPPSFCDAFVEFLSNRTQLRVAGVSSRQRLERGTVYVVSGDTHLGLVSPDHVAPLPGEPRAGLRPSADILFESIVRWAGDRAAGVILSGMGEDGAQGLRGLRKKGGLCLAQNESTAAVWGMPRAALALGAAERSLDPPGLARATEEWAWATNPRAR